jgi:hypothetical protein
MSWFSSSKPLGTPLPKLETIKAPEVDFNAAKFDASYVQQLQRQSAEALASTQKQAEALGKAAASTISQATSSISFWKIIGGLLALATAVVIGLLIYDWFAPCDWPNVFYERASCVNPSAPSSTSSSPPAPPPSTSGGGPTPQKQYSSQPYVNKLVSYFTGSDSSGDLLGRSHNTQTPFTIKGTDAPLSSQNEGAYGMQWWMFVKDWNYGYGKEKSVVQRPDPTNSAVMNPSITMHPTDNTLRVSVSIFPSSEGGAAKSTPAPAGSSSSTDDVFVCEVSDIPLQTWFSVSMTVFGRNMDIYIDGKLVKSCFLPGVPKPASGDITLTSGGGFSGQMCNFYHFPRMITPGDAMLFWSSGTSCRGESGTDTGGSSSATGYSVKFGVYDSLGKEVQEYAF